MTLTAYTGDWSHPFASRVAAYVEREWAALSGALRATAALDAPGAPGVVVVTGVVDTVERALGAMVARFTAASRARRMPYCTAAVRLATAVAVLGERVSPELAAEVASAHATRDGARVLVVCLGEGFATIVSGDAEADADTIDGSAAACGSAGDA